MVGARGFEPPASRSRTVRSTKLSYAPTGCAVYSELKRAGLNREEGENTALRLSGSRREVKTLPYGAAGVALSGVALSGAVFWAPFFTSRRACQSWLGRIAAPSRRTVSSATRAGRQRSAAVWAAR
jgi:hypothetical protein